MQLKIDKRFSKDTSKVKDLKLLNKLGHLLKQIKSVDELHQIDNIKRIVGKKHYYRIRIGNY